MRSTACRSTRTPEPSSRPCRCPIRRSSGPASASSCPARCPARSTRRLAVGSTPAARSPRIAAASRSHYCVNWSPAIGSPAIWPRRPPPSRSPLEVSVMAEPLLAADGSIVYDDAAEARHRVLREQFLVRPDVTFLNHGSYGACPAPVFETYLEWQRELERQPVEFLGRRRGQLMADARAALAAFLNADADE